MRPALIGALVVGSTMLIVGVRAEQARDRDTSWVAPAADTERSNPLAQRRDAIAGGAKVYRQRCSTCHGDDGHGTPKAPDLSAADVQAQSDGAMFWKITSGNTHAGMPTFSFLPELQRWQLVLQLRALAAGRGMQ
jgi:mono/diheme cytochrome c family protein